MIRDSFRLLGDVIFTARCDICGEVISVGERRCADCLSAKRIEGKTCRYCGKPKSECKCSDSGYNKPRYNGIFAPYYYDGSIKNAVRRLKFSGYTELADTMGREIADTIRKRATTTFDIVTFVPISPKKKKRRGFNQAELIAQKVAAELGVSFVPTLNKIISTDSQRTKSGRHRGGNVFGVYDLAKDVSVESKIILVVDDVRTTGATLSECADMLKIYGAKAVYAASFAIR